MIETSFNALLLCSGGLDSTTLAYWMKQKKILFIPLFIDYGQHFADTEYKTLLKVLPPEAIPLIKRIDLSSVYRGCNSRLISEADLWTEKVVADDLYLPYRNIILLTVGSAYAMSRGIKVVYSAFINSNHAREIDCSAAFFTKLGKIFADYGSVKIKMPFREMSKYEVAELGLKLGAPIAKTFSCLVSSTTPCGACPNCVERLNALSRLT